MDIVIAVAIVCYLATGVLTHKLIGGKEELDISVLVVVMWPTIFIGWLVKLLTKSTVVAVATSIILTCVAGAVIMVLMNKNEKEELDTKVRSIVKQEIKGTENGAGRKILCPK